MDIYREQLNSVRGGSLVSLVKRLIACNDDQESGLLHTAFYDVLKEKFYDRLKKVTSKLYSGIPDWEGRMEEVFSDTFIVAFKEIKTFEVGDEWDNQECQKVILNWMSKIANNLLLKLAKATKKEKGIFEIYRDVQRYDLNSGQELERKTYKQTYDKSKFDRFWEKLNPMSKEILLICADLGTIKAEGHGYLSDKHVELLKLKNNIDSSELPKEVKKFAKQDEFIERNTNHLPDEILEYLKLKYGVKRPAINKAKERALKGLRNCKI
jgi:hypothetical protein